MANANIAEAIVNMIAANAAAHAETETEYLADDGLLHCKICGGQRQTVIQLPFDGALPKIVRCWCNCPTEHDKFKQRQREETIARRRAACFSASAELKGCNFLADDMKGAHEATQTARSYAEDFSLYLRSGKGLLLYGGVGTGKTFLAACIANAVINNGYSAKVTSFANIADEMWSAENKSEYLESLCRYSLLVLDDLGVERKTHYMQEMIYKIVNARYASGMPIVVTTNLTPQELSKPADIGYARIYDRILEVCLPVKVDGKSRRRENAAENWNDMRRDLEEKR